MMQQNELRPELPGTEVKRLQMTSYAKFYRHEMSFRGCWGPFILYGIGWADGIWSGAGPKKKMTFEGGNCPKKVTGKWGRREGVEQNCCEMKK